MTNPIDQPFADHTSVGDAWRLADAGYDRLDMLPFGAVVIDVGGRILAYNQYEARLARNDRDAVIGKNFFLDIAPCTAVRDFWGRLETFVATTARASERFLYFFPFAHGPVDVAITFLKLRDNDRILIAIERSDGEPCGPS